MEKPSKRILELKQLSEKRYEDKDSDTRSIATLLNLVKLISEILDEHEIKINKNKRNGKHTNTK